MMLLFPSFLQISEIGSIIQFGKLGEEIHKPVSSYVFTEIKWKRHCQVVVTHILT